MQQCIQAAAVGLSPVPAAGSTQAQRAPPASLWTASQLCSRRRGPALRLASNPQGKVVTDCTLLEGCVGIALEQLVGVPRPRGGDCCRQLPIQAIAAIGNCRPRNRQLQDKIWRAQLRSAPVRPSTLLLPSN